MPQTPITAIVAPQRGIGVAPPAAQAADTVNGNSFVNDGRELLLINNPGGSTATVTIAQTQAADGVLTAGLAIAVPAGSSRWLPHFPLSIYGASVGLVASGAGAASITYLVLALPPGV